MYQPRLCSHTLLSAKPDKHKASPVRQPCHRNQHNFIFLRFSGRKKNQQSCSSLFIRCLFYRVVPRPPHRPNVLMIPLTSALSCSSDSSCSRSHASVQVLTVSLPWCLPLVTMYKCKVVSRSLVYCCHLFLFLFY